MTTMSEKEVECSICSTKSSHAEITSSSACGSADLDTRPPEMARSTVYYRIKECPSCGYCSSDLSTCSSDTKELIESVEYKTILSNEHMPKMASSFLASAYEKEQTDRLHDAAWGAIQAAWICDDENNHEAAIQCRKRAISLIEKAISKNQKIASDEGATEAITIDLMRRAGMFQEAKKLVAIIKGKGVEGIILDVINFGEKLIDQKNTTSHTISEALGEKGQID